MSDKTSPGPWSWDEHMRRLYRVRGAAEKERLDREAYLGPYAHAEELILRTEHEEAPSRSNALLIAKAPEMASMLRELEWSVEVTGVADADADACPICHQVDFRGHAPDCRLAALLSELP